MPVLPANRRRYPPDWPQTRARILERARWCCEWCGVGNYWYVVWRGDHSDENLAALCQRCHLGYDRLQHAQSAYMRRREGRALGELF